MKRSNPSTDVGGGEMNRDTSSVDNMSSRASASDMRSSRKLIAPFDSTGSRWRQSVIRTAAGSLSAARGSGHGTWTAASCLRFVSMSLSSVRRKRNTLLTDTPTTRLRSIAEQGGCHTR